MKVQILLVVLGFVAGISAAPINGEQIKNGVWTELRLYETQ